MSNRFFAPQKFYTAGLFLIFAVALLLMHDLIWLYHDDYGYATLSYITNIENVRGQNFTQFELLTFLKNEYMSWTGRVVPFFIEANSFKLGLPFTRFLQCVVIITIAWITAKLATHNSPLPLTSAAVIIYLFSLPVFVAAGGVFWFSASISYVWGLPFLLFGAYRLQRGRRFSWQAVAALSLAALFQEQIAIACLVVAGLFALEQLMADRRFKKMLLLTVTTAPILLSASFVLFSPGNFNRKALSKYPSEFMWETAQINLEKISNTLLSPVGNPKWTNDSTIWLIFLGLSFMTLILGAISQNRTIIPKILTGLALLISLAYAFDWPEYYILMWLLLGYGTALFGVQKGHNSGYVVTYIYIAAVMTLVLILASPSIAGRQYVPFFFLMLVPVTYSFSMALESKQRWLACVLLVAFMPVATEQSFDIYKKYQKNDAYMQSNDIALREASQKIRNGETVNSVMLTKLPDSRYAETMPYRRPRIEKWMRRYYILPDDVPFEWHPPKKP
jgi:hypothetical protein